MSVGLPRRRKRWAALAVVVLAAAAVVPGCSALRAGAVLRDALGPPEALAESVVERDERAPHGTGSLRVRLAVPADDDGPWPAILLVHGAAAGGPDDPRMVAFARSLAAHGFAVGSLDLEGLAEFRIDAEDPARVVSAASWLAGRSDVARNGRVALGGISVGGAYALLASADPRIEGRVTSVLAFGAYADLETLLLAWMTTSAPATEGMLDPHAEGRRLVLLGNLGRLVPGDERAPVAAGIRAAMRGGPPADRSRLSEDAGRVLDAAETTQPLAPADARALLAPFSSDLAVLSPARSATAPRTQVFLLHAEGDPVVPAADAAILGAALERRGAEVEVHVTDLFGHVDARGGEAPSIFVAWPLLRFVGRFLDAAAE